MFNMFLCKLLKNKSCRSAHTGFVAAKSIHICICTWERGDEVPLQHGFEVGVNVAVLVVAHTGDQALDKLHLVGL